jgi:adenylate cyclase
MGIEIERKYLVTSDEWRHLTEPVPMQQGYLAITPENSVRVRITRDEAWLTVKGPAQGGAKPEFEYPVPLADARELIRLSRYPLIEKQRYAIPFAGLIWEVDEFFGANAGLVVAEVELAKVDQAVALPAWVGEEVTQDPRYLNAHLCQYPYSKW